VLAQTGLSLDLATVSGKLMRTIMAGLSEFERDLIRERVKSCSRPWRQTQPSDGAAPERQYGKGLMVVVPDLAKSEVRLIKLNR
jgi:hypothetical protein